MFLRDWHQPFLWFFLIFHCNEVIIYECRPLAFARENWSHGDLLFRLSHPIWAPSINYHSIVSQAASKSLRSPHTMLTAVVELRSYSVEWWYPRVHRFALEPKLTITQWQFFLGCFHIGYFGSLDTPMLLEHFPINTFDVVSCSLETSVAWNSQMEFTVRIIQSVF